MRWKFATRPEFFQDRFWFPFVAILKEESVFNQNTLIFLSAAAFSYLKDIIQSWEDYRYLKNQFRQEDFD